MYGKIKNVPNHQPVLYDVHDLSGFVHASILLFCSSSLLGKKSEDDCQTSKLSSCWGGFLSETLLTLAKDNTITIS